MYEDEMKKARDSRALIEKQKKTIKHMGNNILL